MKIFSELKRVTRILENYPDQWAVCGGVAASIYRETARFTDDIDFALVDSDVITASDLAIKIIRALGYKEYYGFVPDPRAEGQQLQALLCARGTDDERFKGIDFLLPVQPWVKNAVEIAQNNRINYGFAKLPTVTPECLIFAKLIALNNNIERYQDLDDIKEIMKANQISLDYINDEIANSGMIFKPRVLKLLDR